jgi:hypothetical protein
MVEWLTHFGPEGQGEEKLTERRGNLLRASARLWRPQRCLTGRPVRPALAASAVLLIVVTGWATGCSTARPQISAISVSNPSGSTQGKITSVVVNATVDVSVTVVNDGPNLGVDWNVTCGGSPNTIETTNVCGTLNPAHVGSTVEMLYTAPAYVPVGNTVTLAAQVTSDPAVQASLVLTILPQPVTLAWTGGNAPSTNMAADGVQPLAATVSNDPISAGVNWSVTCGASQCGSFNPVLTAGNQPTNYTAPPAIPPESTVTVTATSVYDNTKSISATITIQPIAVTATISPMPVQAGETATLTATVTWDVSGDGVSWSTPACGESQCGTIQSAACSPLGAAPAYTTTCTAQYVPPTSIQGTSLPISTTAASVANPAASSMVAFNVIPALPISVSVAAVPQTVQVNGSVTLTATASNDFTSSGKGVSWQCSPGTCIPSTSTTAPYTTKYVAPASVPSPDPTTVSATSNDAPASDPTRTGSTTIEIVPAISVAMSASNPATITAGTAAQFSATVTNDIAPGGINWSASCGGSSNCGTFTGNTQTANGNSVTYTTSFTAAPDALWSDFPTVTITATSVASLSVPPMQWATGQATVTPVALIQFVPYLPTALPASNALATSPTFTSLIAISANDSSHEGVDWSVCAGTGSCAPATSACTGSTAGQFLITPGAPAIQTATHTVPAVAPVCGNTIHAASGQAVSYLPPSTVPSGGTVDFSVSSTANPAVTASQSVAITANLTGVALAGKVMVGNQPVAGAQVQLYEAGNGGNGSAAFPLVISNGGNTVTTDQNGNFSISAGYTCGSQNSLLYLVALNGNPGGVGANSQLGLMTALGPCDSLNSSASVVVNEVTTVASVWALVPFIGNENPDGYSSSDFQYIGSTSTNYSNGLANAFAAVNNLVDIGTGEALLFTPGGGAFTPPGPASAQPVLNGLVPQAEINTLADAINSCAATSGLVSGPGDGSACDNFFFAANVNPNGGGYTHETEPTSILAAVIAVARRPASCLNSSLSESGTPMYSLAAALTNPPFTPILTEAPSDWSIALNFSGGGIEGLREARAESTELVIDGAGNVWVANPNISSVTEMTNLGVAVSPYASGYHSGDGGGFTGGGLESPEEIAVDPVGNVWALNAGNDSLTELNSIGAAVTCGSNPSASCGGSTLSTPFSGAGNSSNSPVGLTIDESGNVWVAESGSPGDVAEYAGFEGSVAGGKAVLNGGALSPVGKGYTTLTEASDPLDASPANPNGAIGVDGSGNVWLLDQANYTAVELSSNGGLSHVSHGFQSTNPPPASNPVFGATTFGNTLAIDKNGNVFVPNDVSGQAVYEIYPCGSVSDPNCLGLGAQAFFIAAPVLASSLAFDGSDGVWMMTQACTGCVGPGQTEGTPPTLLDFSESGSRLNQNLLDIGYIGPPSVQGQSTGSTAQSIGVDSSGNVWLLFSGASTTVTEFIGVATPAVTPLSLGKPGATP